MWFCIYVRDPIGIWMVDGLSCAKDPHKLGNCPFGQNIWSLFGEVKIEKLIQVWKPISYLYYQGMNRALNLKNDNLLTINSSTQN